MKRKINHVGSGKLVAVEKAQANESFGPSGKSTEEFSFAKKKELKKTNGKIEENK